MKLLCWNVNGLKPTHKNIELQYGSLENFFNGLDLDIVCFQEVKVNADDVPRSLKHVPGFESFWSFSTAKKGYSGCVTYVRLEHAAHNFADDSEMPGEADLKAEGRVLITEHQNFVLINVYAPNAGDSLHRPRLEFKMRWFESLRQKITQLTMTGRQVILVGDLNIPRSRADVSMELSWEGLYTQEEVVLVNTLATDLVDVWRNLHPDAADTFTVWNERTNARAYNRGLRIDYAMCSQGLLSHVVDCQVKLDLPQKWSDHAPVVLELSGITTYAHDPPAPCQNSSRAVPKHGLQALFQRHTVESQACSQASSMHTTNANKATEGGSDQPHKNSYEASALIMSSVKLVETPETAEALPVYGNPSAQAGRPPAVRQSQKRAMTARDVQVAARKQVKVTNFFSKKS